MSTSLNSVEHGLEFQQGYAVVVRQQGSDCLRSFHSGHQAAAQTADQSIDCNPLRVASAKVCYATNGNVRMWKLLH